MDRTNLSAAMIQEMGAVFTVALDDALPALLGSDLAEMEQRVRTLGRAVVGQVITRVIRLHATLGAEERGACPGCGGTLACVDRARVRRLQGLVGDYTVRRVYYRCAQCGQGHIPLDAQLGLGTGVLSPGLARVVCREGIDGAFENAVDSVAESLGVTLTAEVARQTTAGLGLVAEAPVQAAMARVARGQRAWTAHAVEAPPVNGVLAVEVDGLFVHRDDDWHEMKVVTVAPLGPERAVDADTGRERLAWGEASYGAGFEEAQAFWGRAHVEACRRGLGTRAVHTVVLIADTAKWIWHSGRAFLGLPGVELVEILDLYHVYEYLWMVGNTVFGPGTAAAAAWVEPLKTRLYAQGPAPVQAALATLTDVVRATEEPAAEESLRALTVRRAVDYFTTHAARLDYPSFVARAFPIGSGAVESSGKIVIQARTKGAGMRWSAAGAQQVVSLRALHRSGRWDAFWQSQPQRARLRLVPRQRHQPTVVPAVAPSPADAAPVPAPPVAPSALAPQPLRRPEVAFLCVQQPGQLDEEQTLYVERLRQREAAVATAHDVVQGFVRLMRARRGADLDAWIEQAVASGIDRLERFARGLRDDGDAVRAGLTLDYSNGQTEGHVHRLKLVRRSMYGRGTFAMLERRVLCAA